MQTPLQSEERRDVIAQGIQSAVSRGMDSPYRDAIVDGVEDGGGHVAGAGDDGGRRRSLGIGLSTTFLVLGVAYLLRRRMRSA